MQSLDTYRIERLNCCDLVINPAFCGGFELALIEAQACGIPIAVTDDHSIMAEVVGNSAFLMPAADEGIWRTGARQFFISGETIADTILEIKDSE